MLGLALLFPLISLVAAETGIDAWLRYARLPSAESFHSSIPGSIVVLNQTQGSPVFTAGQELQKGLNGIFGKPCGYENSSSTTGSATVGTVEQYCAAGGEATTVPALEQDGYWLDIQGSTVRILGQNERGALYGAFQYLSMLAQGNLTSVTYASNPSAPVRWVNQWDNLQAGGTHGSVERGYGGPSIFFANGSVKADLSRAAQYARILASVGINGVVVNNVNANESMVTPHILDGLKRIADEFRPYGVQLAMSPYFASPQALHQLNTSDPLDPAVINWWQNVTDMLYERVPDMGGFLIKANSEGQPGPLSYNRTLAQGANLFAKAVQSYGGIVMFRAFVYDSTTFNETQWREDRANAAVQFFDGLDGEFDDNVIVQIKYGPIDFQVREPTSPLFAHLQQTSTAIELEITQEYLGQQCHLVYLPPLWDTVLNFDLRVNNQTSYVRDIVTGKRFNRKLGGYAGVANVGTNQTWLGSHLAMSNLYAFGRLAWDPTSTPSSMVEDWTRLTFSLNSTVIDTITSMSLESWPNYENYSGNLGIQTLTDILFAHYGPNPASQDNNPWGQWTRADAFSIGMDRTIANGTGYSGQYPPEVSTLYQLPETTPPNLLLWFHHLNYTSLVPTTNTSIIQHFYNAHYAGSSAAQSYSPRWASLASSIDPQRHAEVAFRLTYQAGHALVWRDAINNFYANLSSIPDEQGRVGNHPYRIEAEDMQMEGYVPYKVSPWNVASNGTAVVTATNTTTGSLSAVLSQDGRFDVAVNYFDLAIGRATWQLSIGGREVGSWVGNADETLGHSPSFYLDGHSATRITFKGVEVRKGDVLKIVGKADGMEPAPVDYVSILPEGVVD
ncbi:glycoside hydrolase family 67 protein [Myriangium duriaei CBS 260.36]|uniref:Alpha-glucuronidase n=1 Tax=Myriangium duriaei CBS 260.36 TaxID=1168546 RepID=A0A9P4J1R6_9PEZI|nr:glycoside hydrolase family 67 protein [Myriangium duriaei CBS 260.36]